MINSIKNHKGFYIGRYETSGISTTDVTKTPTIQKGGTVGGGNWYYHYQESKNIAKNSNVISSMIWGCQWDRVMEWIVDTNRNALGEKDYSIVTDSSSWGNYNNYKTVTGDEKTSSGGNNPQPSGTNPAWQKNHIYDLAGNVCEKTIEAMYNYIRVGRRRKLQWKRFNSFSISP